MANSLCKHYVKWFNALTNGRWATWEPGDELDPGAVGWFDQKLEFRHWRTLHDYGIPMELSEEVPRPSKLYLTEADFDIGFDAGGALPTTGHAISLDGAQLSLRATHAYCHVLQTGDATERTLLNLSDVFDAVRNKVLSGAWPIDHCVVTSRIRSRSGFALLLKRQGQEARLAVDVGLSAGGVLDIVKANITPSAAGHRLDHLQYPFGELATPIFEAPIGVNRRLWARLLGIKRKGTRVVDPSGHPWSLNDEPPRNLQHLKESDTYYDPAVAQLSPHEILNMSLEEFFQPIRHIEDETTPPPPDRGNPAPDSGADSGDSSIKVVIEPYKPEPQIASTYA